MINVKFMVISLVALALWGCSHDPKCKDYDANGDGRIGVDDYLELGQRGSDLASSVEKHFGEECN